MSGEVVRFAPKVSKPPYSEGDENKIETRQTYRELSGLTPRSIALIKQCKKEGASFDSLADLIETIREEYARQNY